MNIPFRLRRRADPVPATALWLATADAPVLVDVCARLGGDWPRVYAVAGGYVVVPESAPPGGVPRAVRLRRLAEHLFIPTDADLTPTLRPDEAADLTRTRGLLFLPGGQLLAFNPAHALQPSAVVAPVAVHRDAWQPFPPRPERAEHLHALVFTGPTQPLAVLEQGRPAEDGDDPSTASAADAMEKLRRADAPPLRKVAGRARLGLGRFLSWLGRLLGWPAMASAGAGMIERALASVPRLSEALLGRQEAALRELIGRFQAGDLDWALRHALPFADPDAPATGAAGDARLPDSEARYSLRGLFGGRRRGPAWFGGSQSAWNDLAGQYRRVAQEAAARGDFRRAAYIYGMLLRDLRAAANALAAGALHHDAAVLYRDKLHDDRAAAGAFEQAGDWDEALNLYRKIEQFDKVGDLLRRMGDEPAAFAAYRSAAERMAREPGGRLRAGDFLRDRVGRLDLARQFYEEGWRGQAADETTLCAERLLNIDLDEGNLPTVWHILDEAEARYATLHWQPLATRLFNAVARASGRTGLTAEVRDELRDRARRVFSGYLREAAATVGRNSPVVSETFGREQRWPAPLVRDASLALRRAAVIEQPMAGNVGPTVRLVDGPVTAVVLGRETSDIVVASAKGAVACWRAADGRIDVVAREPHPVTSLATDAKARLVVVQHGVDDESTRLRSYLVEGGASRFFSERLLAHPSDAEPESSDLQTPPPRLLPVIHCIFGDFRIDLAKFPGVESMRGIRLSPLPPGERPSILDSAHLIVQSGPYEWAWGDDQVWFHSIQRMASGSGLWQLAWQPGVLAGATLRCPVVDWLATSPTSLQLVGVTISGGLYWSALEERDGQAHPQATLTATPPIVFRGATLVQNNRLAAVTSANELMWLRADDKHLRSWAQPVQLKIPSRAAAVLYRPAASDVAVIFEDGTAVSVPVPR